MHSVLVFLLLAVVATKSHSFVRTHPFERHRYTIKPRTVAIHAVTFPEKTNQIPAGIPDIAAVHSDDSRTLQLLRSAHKKEHVFAEETNSDKTPTMIQYPLKTVDLVLYFTVAIANGLFWTDPVLFSLLNLGAVVTFLLLDYAFATFAVSSRGEWGDMRM